MAIKLNTLPKTMELMALKSLKNNAAMQHPMHNKMLYPIISEIIDGRLLPSDCLLNFHYLLINPTKANQHTNNNAPHNSDPI